MQLRTLYRLAAFGLGFASVGATAATTDDRLADLEKRLSALEQENASLRQQLALPAKGANVVPQGKEAKLAIGGFMQLQGEFGDAPDSRFPTADRFLVRRARLGARGSFSEGFDFVLQADLGSNSLSSTSGFRAQLTDAYVLWNKYSAANVTVGQFKVPYGYEQLLSDTKLLMIERSLPNDALTLPRQVGAMVAGAFFDKKLTYAVALGNGNGNNNSFNDNDQFDTIGRIAGTVFNSRQLKVTAGVNGFTSYDTGAFTGHRDGRGADLQFFAGPAELDAEILRTHYNRDVGTDYDAQGWSVTAGYTLVPNQWQASFRYERYDPNTDLSGDITTLRTIGLSYLIKGDDIKLLVNYVIGNPPTASSHQDRLLTRLQLIF